MRFLVDVTEPLLGPLRRVMPRSGRFDISPIVAILIVWLFQAAVAGTLLRGARFHTFELEVFVFDSASRSAMDD